MNQKKSYKSRFIPKEISNEKKTMDKPKIRRAIKISVLCLLGIAIIIGLNAFFNTFYLVSPIRVQSPVRRRGTIYPMIINEKELDNIIEEEVEKGRNQLPSLELVEPQEEEIGKLRGKASYYSIDGCLGCDPEAIMANGVKLDDSKFTLALTPAIVREHKLLNKIVEVKNTDTGKTVNAMVTDTGGFGKYNRVADLSLATKNYIGCGDLCNVEIYY